jgi:hypothetical protein
MRPTPTGEHVVVETKAGAVRGFWRTDSAAFLGIPFAEPPCGDLRFLAPVPVEISSGVRDALQYRPTPQRKALAEVTTIPEPSIPGDDTLNLNVFTPRPRAVTLSDALPVLVYIHGGGYVAGSPASPWYDGAAFNRDGVANTALNVPSVICGERFPGPIRRSRFAFAPLPGTSMTRGGHRVHIISNRIGLRSGHPGRPVGRRPRETARHAGSGLDQVAAGAERGRAEPEGIGERGGLCCPGPGRAQAALAKMGSRP